MRDNVRVRNKANAEQADECGDGASEERSRERLIRSSKRMSDE